MAKIEELVAAASHLEADVQNLKSVIATIQANIVSHDNEDSEKFNDIQHDIRAATERIHSLELMVSECAKHEDVAKIQLTMAGQTSWWEILRTIGNFLLLTALSYIAYRLGFGEK